MTCHIFAAGAIAAPCAECGVYAERVHYVEERQALFCGEHCPCCRQASLEWEGPVETVKGEQGGFEW